MQRDPREQGGADARNDFAAAQMMRRSLQRARSNYAELQQQLREARADLIDAQSMATRSELKLARLRSSLSWRITRPLRRLQSIVRRFLHSAEGEPPMPERDGHDLKHYQQSMEFHHTQDIIADSYKSLLACKFDYAPLISILMCTCNTPPDYLRAAVRSVIRQLYANWELRLVDDGSEDAATLDVLDHLAAWDERILVVRNARSRGIAAAMNDALDTARGEYIALLGAHDELTVDALGEVLLVLNADRATDVIYSDQDDISPSGRRVGVSSKPDWSPEFFRGTMYVGQLMIVRGTLAREAGGFAGASDQVGEFEFMLRVSERTRRIHHVPEVLYHRRRQTAGATGADDAQDGINALQVAAVQAHLRRLGLDGEAKPHPRHPHRLIIDAGPSVRNAQFDLIVHGAGAPAAVENALTHTTCRVSDLAVPKEWPAVKISRTGATTLAPDDAAEGVSEADRLRQLLEHGANDFVVVLSAAVTIETDGWMEQLLRAAQERDVAMVCPAILSADGLVAHAGLTVGPDGQIKPAMQGMDPDSDGDAGVLSCAREISAAGADLVLLRRSALIALLPPESSFATADVCIADLGMRATRAGLRLICVPYVRARRSHSTENDRHDHRVDAFVFQDIWASEAGADPFFSRQPRIPSE